MRDQAPGTGGASSTAGRAELEHDLRWADDLIDALPGVFYVFGTDLRFKRWNRAFERVTGYDAAELTEITPLDLFEEGDRERVAGRIGAVFESGESTVDADLVSKDGTRTPYHFTGRLSEVAGETVLVGMGIDISRRKRYEAERDRLLHDMGERIKELRCLHGVAEVMRSADELHQMLGQVVDVLPPGWRHPGITCARIVFDDNTYGTTDLQPTPWRLAADILVEDRTRGQVEVWLTETPDGGEEAFLEEERELIASVATSLGEAVARRESEARYRSLFTSVPVSIWDEDWSRVIAKVRELHEAGVTDFAAYFRDHPEVVQECLAGVVITDVNQATVEMFGADSKEEMLASLETVFATPDTLPGFVGELVALAEGRRQYRTEMDLNTVRGDRITVLLTMTFPRDDDPSGRVLVSLMDISELERTLAALEQSNTELEQFAYVASHDLQEPLRMVASYLQLIERRYADALDDDGREFIEYAVDGARRMKGMINDLLTYSRIATRGDEPRATSAGDALAAATTSLGGAISDSGATVTADELPPVHADPSQLERLFQNLVSNAIKFRGDAPPTIHVTAERQHDEWCFSVADNGIGIDPQYEDRVFDIFQRLHPASRYPGSGIGLAICRRIVSRHGGRIWFESSPGEGTTFHFTLPAAAG